MFLDLPVYLGFLLSHFPHVFQGQPSVGEELWGKSVYFSFFLAGIALHPICAAYTGAHATSFVLGPCALFLMYTKMSFE